MVFKRLIRLFKLWQLKRKYATVPVQQPHRAYCLELLHLLDPKDFLHYRPNKGLGVQVKAPFSTLGELIEQLRIIEQRLLIGEAMPRGIFHEDSHTLSLDRFLSTQDGFYLKPDIGLERFKKIATRICELMEESDHAEYGIHEHNFRMLAKYFVMLRALTVVLIRVDV